MKKELLTEIIQCMPQERTLYHYHKDHYAAWMLQQITQQGVSVKQLKQSPYASLLNKPLIKSMLSNKGKGLLKTNDFEQLWQEPSIPYMLTLGQWGGDRQWGAQTTRKGENLVLQLNFNNQHNQVYQNLLEGEDQDLLRVGYHPIIDRATKAFKHETLAWARIDIDFSTGEALIEEIQNDWLRRAKRWGRCIKYTKSCRYCAYSGFGKSERYKAQVVNYVNQTLAPYYKIWSEAMLSASLWFIVEELGLKKIYYHTQQSGAVLKNIEGWLPPRSLYSDLPKKFCFKKTKNAPLFLQSDKRLGRYLKRKKKHDIDWYLLNLEANHAIH